MLETPPTQRRGIALDMDVVITDSMRFHVAAWLYAFQQYGIAADPAWFYLLEGVIAPEVITRTLEKYDRVLSAEEQAALHQIKTAHFREIFEVAAIPGIHALAELLDSCGYVLSVVTGSSREVAHRSLKALGLDTRIRCLVSGDDVQRGKPHPEPYLKAISAMQTPAELSLVVENAPAGIESARHAGLYCLAVQTTLPAAALSAADRVLADLDEAAAWLRAEFARSQGVGAWRAAQ
jgi:beta-phosphoglucomutase